MLNDFKFIFRRLRQSPGFVATALATLTLAIGVNTAIFSIADAVLFRPLPYENPNSVFVLRMLNRQTNERFTQIPYHYLQAIDQNCKGITGIGMCESGPDIIIDSIDGAERVPTIAVSVNYFQLLGVIPAYGRSFESFDKSQNGRPAMLSYAAWRKRFNGDERIVGQSVKFGGMAFDILGILPSGFVFPSPAIEKPEIVTVMESVTHGAGGGFFYPVTRLKSGITHQQAQAEIGALIAQYNTADSRGSHLVPVLDDVRSVLYPVGRSIMILLLIAAAFVLLIGCSNLAIMLLARSKRNEYEIGIRVALGASRAWIVRPLILEAVLISMAGAVLAIFATAVTFDTFIRQVPEIAYRNAPVGVNLRVVIFAVGLGLFTGLAFSTIPAWRAARLNTQGLIQRGNPYGIGKSRKIGQQMIAIQVALSVTLVFCAVIAGRAFLSVASVKLGFNPENIITIDIKQVGQTGMDHQAFYVHMLEKLAQRSNVLSAGAAGSLPLGGRAPDDGAFAVGSTDMAAGIIHVLPGYFESLGITLVRGRLLNYDDLRGDTGASVISESAARRLFPDRDSLGATFTNSSGRQLFVVGLVSDVQQDFGRENVSSVYTIPGKDARRLTLVVRVQTRREELLSSMKREISPLAPDGLVSVKWWAESISGLAAYRNPRFQTLVFGTFAILALTLTALGIFSIVAFWTAASTHEMGVRLAFGASPHSLICLIIRQTLIPIIAGLLFGIIIIRWTSRIAEKQFFLMDTHDSVMIVIAILTVVNTALITAYLSGRRVSRIDPMIVLRTE